MHISKPAIFSLWVLLAACGGSADPSDGPDAAATPAQSSMIERGETLAPRDPASATGFFVWTRDGEGQAQTHRLDTRGREVETLDGIFIATAAGTWQWREQDLPIAT